VQHIATGRDGRQPATAASALRPGRVAPFIVSLWTCLGLLGGCVRSDRVAPPSAQPSVLLIGIDTMRADHLGAAGNDSIRTPHLDALARDGVRFAQARATAPWTLPSFASVFTGLWPGHHGAVGGDRTWLDSRHTTMAESFRAAGYAVEGVAAVDWLTGACNMDQGFQPTSGPRPPADLDRPSMETWLARSFCERMGGRPFFFFLHYFDVHTPYTPPAPFDGMYYRGDPYAPGEPILDLLRSTRTRAPNRDGDMYDFLAGVTDLAYPVKQYAAGVSYVDDHVGQVIARLRELGIYDDMLIIVLSDHGEHLGEHDLWFTHFLPYEETLRVPLIVKLPRNRHAGTVVAEPVSLADVLPTVLGEAGLAPADPLDGRDLGPLMAGRDRGRSVIVSEQGTGPEQSCRTLQEGGWKLLVFRDGGAERQELYDLSRDPGERHDLWAAYPDTAARLRARRARLWRPDAPPPSRGEPAPPALDAAAKKRLRSLGY